MFSYVLVGTSIPGVGETATMRVARIIAVTPMRVYNIDDVTSRGRA
jgi:hypothetical protein